MNEPGRAVFISYASEDSAAALRIAVALRAAGIDVWLDQAELRGGDAWDTRLRSQIKSCALFIPLISANTNARREGYFRREWKLAGDRTIDMDEALPFLVPVVIDTTNDAVAVVPDRFRAVQWTWLPGGAATSAFAERLRNLLQGDHNTCGNHQAARRCAACPAREVGRRARLRQLEHRQRERILFRRH